MANITPTRSAAPARTEKIEWIIQAACNSKGIKRDAFDDYKSADPNVVAAQYEAIQQIRSELSMRPEHIADVVKFSPALVNRALAAAKGGEAVQKPDLVRKKPDKTIPRWKTLPADPEECVRELMTILQSAIGLSASDLASGSQGKADVGRRYAFLVIADYFGVLKVAYPHLRRNSTAKDTMRAAYARLHERNGLTYESAARVCQELELPITELLNRF